jgi:hypothetical protein
LKTDRCPACGRRQRRTSQANAYYWLLLHEIAERVKPGGQSYSADTYHQYCKSRWLGCDDTRLPNGKTLTIPRSTAALSTEEFAEYVAKVEAWAAERGVYLADREAA